MANGKHPLSPNGLTWAILDANALLPPRLSDILFDICVEDFYQPCWTKSIEEEFLRNFPKIVLGKNAVWPANKVHPGAFKRLNAFQNAAGPEYEVFLYDQKRFTDRVPKEVHANDKHVVSAALVLQENVTNVNSGDQVFIVSSNVAHLARPQLKSLGVTVVTPGEFIDLIFAAVGTVAMENVLNRTVNDLVAPTFTQKQLLGCLVLHGAKQTARQYSKKWKVQIPTQ